jgi:T4 superinfection immunity protein
MPGLIAGGRGHHDAAAIFMLNLLLFSTFVGWAIALVWALTAVRRNAPHY